MTDDSRESVLSRWSRRKLEAKEAEENSPESIELAKLEAGGEGSLAEAPVEPEAPPLTDADMPDIETLTDESDFSPLCRPALAMNSGIWP